MPSRLIRRSRYWWLVLCFIAVISSEASGLEASFELASLEEDYWGEVPLVLTPTRLRQPITEAPVSMTVIDRETILASGFQDIADLLRLVPGFQVAQGNGNYFVPTYHGLVDDWPRRMEVQIDGRSVYLPVLSTVDWTYLGLVLDDIERIEVIRGSNAPVYGSNAFLGVVNIITRQPFQDRGWYLRSTLGSLYAGRLKAAMDAADARAMESALDSREAVLRYASDFSGWDYRATFNYRRDEGFVQVDDSRTVSAASFRAVNTLSATDRMDVQLGYSTGLAGTGVHDSDINFFNMPRDKDTTTYYESVQWTRAWSPVNELSLRFYHNAYKQYDNYSLGSISSVLTAMSGNPVTPQDVPNLFQGRPDQQVLYGEHDARAHRFDLELQHVLQLRPGTRLIWGAGLRLDRLKSRWSLGRDGYVEDKSQRVFVNLQWQAAEKLLVSSGTMVEHNQIIGMHQSPRLALNYLLDENRTWRMSATRSIRSPSLMEANVNRAAQFEDGDLALVLRTGSDSLREEKLTAFEIGYIQRIPRWSMEVDGKIFREYITGAIFDSTDVGFEQPRVMTGNQPITFPDDGGDGAGPDDPFVYLNGVDSNIYGLELQLSWKPRHGSLVHFNYAYMQGTVTQLRKIKGSESVPVEYRRLDRKGYQVIPDHTLSLLASHRFANGIQVSGGFYRISAMKWLGDGEALPSYNRLDARLAKMFSLDGYQGYVALIVQNLLEDYYEFRFKNIFGQRLYLQAALEF